MGFGVFYRRYSKLTVIVAGLKFRADYATKSAFQAESAFREFFAALESADSEKWLKYASPEILKTPPVPPYSRAEIIRTSYVNSLAPLLDRFEAEVNWNCSRVVLTVHHGDVGPWVVIMKRRHDGGWMVVNRNYLVNK